VLLWEIIFAWGLGILLVFFLDNLFSPRDINIYFAASYIHSAGRYGFTATFGFHNNPHRRG
jgi:hypothetical protein